MFREELTVEDGLILKGTRIVIPDRSHKAILKLIHEGHLGLSKCKLCAKETIYWPGLNDQLEKLVLKCELCLKYSHSKWEGASYMLVVDYTSRFLVVHKFMSMTGQHITDQCKLISSE